MPGSDDESTLTRECQGQMTTVHTHKGRPGSYDKSTLTRDGQDHMTVHTHKGMPGSDDDSPHSHIIFFKTILILLGGPR